MSALWNTEPFGFDNKVRLIEFVTIAGLSERPDIVRESLSGVFQISKDTFEDGMPMTFSMTNTEGLNRWMMRKYSL